ncbi:MAG: type II toxin-antitoxin system RelE/ParE family toxin [Alphaproteobacteria bacterium]|nr:type II toxin-antitoxin system RelE/ParE family toxin [Alphaproteobacteria bacterium]
MTSRKNFNWIVKFSGKAEKQFRSLDFVVQQRIRRFFADRVCTREDPQALAEPLTGQFSGMHRFRVGDYRIICKFENDTLIIAVIMLGHRKDIYH